MKLTPNNVDRNWAVERRDSRRNAVEAGRMSLVAEKAVLLPEGLRMYLDIVRGRHLGIDEVWLLSQPSDELRDEVGRWVLLAFGSEAVLQALRGDSCLHRGDVQLLLVTDGDRYLSAWGEEESGTLTGIEWRLGGPRSAAYVRPSKGPAVAVRIR